MRIFKTYKITASIFALALLVSSCTGLVKLDLPSVEERDPDQNWTMLGKNDQRQHYSLSNVSPPLDIVWKKRVKSTVVDHPLAIGDYIIAPTKAGELYLVDYLTGNGIGTGKIGVAMDNAPAISGNNILIAMKAGPEKLLKLDLRNAEQEYKQNYPAINTSPLIWQDRAYFGSDRKRFFCADFKSGEEVWQFETEAAVFSSPARFGTSILFADVSGILYSLDIETGEENWRKQLDGSIYSHPVLDESNAYIGTVSGNMYAVSIGDGTIQWERSFSGSVYSSPAIYGNELYIGHNAHELLSIYKSTGEIVWSYSTEGIINTVPLPSPDYVYVTSWDKNLHVVNRLSGQLVFKYELKKPVKSSPIIYREYLLLHLANDQLLALANEKIVNERRVQP